MVCRSVCGVIERPESEAHVAPAAAMWRATSRCNASALRRPPRELGKTGSSGPPRNSASHDSRAAAMSRRSGVQRILRPLPKHRTCAPTPRATSRHRSARISALRSPVWAATSSKVRSRLPIHAVGSGAATSAAVSSSVRKSTGLRSWRLVGIDRTRWHCREHAGSAYETKRKNARRAARRVLRVFAVLARVCSRSSRKAPRSDGERSSTCNRDGARRKRSDANTRSNRNASR